MLKSFKYFFLKALGALLDVLPIIAVIFFFQFLVIQKPLPNPEKTFWGFLLVITGLFIFIEGLETALFPLGESLATQFALKGNFWWILAFGFAIGFSTTIAEPALTIIAGKAGQLAIQQGLIENQSPAVSHFVLGLRLTVAFSVGFAIALGVARIIKGWPLIWFVLSGYGAVVALTQFAPREFIGIAYDSGGITTSTITVPLIAALGVGLASAIRGRNPISDGFGLIALASLSPILFVMAYGIFNYGGR
ncbi:MAG: DUF1538 domain-containing protein [Nitrospinae bacterium]|nr:DUF1538 domain-containing protein [Nitrospinota bacterium]